MYKNYGEESDVNCFVLWKKRLNKSTVEIVRKNLIFMLAFMVAMANMPVLTAKALSATFDYETSTAAVLGFETKTVTQTVNGETLTAVSTAVSMVSNNSLSGETGNDSLATDYGTASETSITFSLASGNAFDLVSINFRDMASLGENIRITSSKGSITTGAIPDSSTPFNVSAQGGASFFRGITSFTLTAVDTEINGMAFDNITLNNIMPMLSTVTGATLSAEGVASWNDVPNESSFEAQLYKGVVAQGAPVPIAADTVTYDFLSAMRGGGAGVYTVKVIAKGDGVNYADGSQSAASGGQTIKQLATVSAGLTWNGDVAHWDTVADAISYDVQLYKGGISLNAPVNVVEANIATGADFAAAITAAGGGTYTYKVTAIGNATLILDAAQSGASNSDIKAIQLAQVTGATISVTGVISWDAVPNASNYEVEVFKGGSSQGTVVIASGSSILPVMRSVGAGAYTIKVKAKGDGTHYSDGVQSIDSASQSIVQLSTVSAGLTWAGNVAHWTTVPSGVSYDVQLYKDGTPLNGPVNVVAASAAAGTDFAAAIAGGGGGTYTYKVTAKGDSVLLLDGAQSLDSNGNLIATPLSQVSNVILSASGVASWNNLANETSFEVQLYKDGIAQGAAVPKTADTLSHDFLLAMRTAGAGVYTVKVTAKGDGINYSDGLQSAASGNQTIAALVAVSAGLNWTGDVAHWTTVANAVSYDVQLYKDGNPLNTQVNVVAGSAAAGADFTAAMAAGGGGTYTYKVIAIADVATLLLDGAQSSASNTNIKAIPLAQVTNAVISASGIASWDNLANESNFEVQLYKDGNPQGVAVTKVADTLSHDFLAAMRGAGVGVYTVKVTAKGNGITYSDGAQSAASAIQSIVQLATVSAGLTWTGNVAHWTTVPSAVSYDVQLYKDGTPLNAPVNVVVASAATGADFTAAMATGGGGMYTYKVTAKGDVILLLDATQSADSNGNLIATPLPQVTNAVLSASGVAVWDNVANESNFEVKLYKDGTTLVATVTKAADTLTHNFLADMRSAGIGVYTVKVSAKGDGTNYSDGPQSLASTGQNITKLATVSAGLTWIGDVAHFTTVANAVSYDVQLYKNGNSLGTPVNVAAASAAAGADFAGVITTNGGGTYTYKVTAIANVTTLFLDAAQSGSSNNNIKAIQLAQVTGTTISPTGVLSWNAVPNASSYEVEVFKGGISQGTAIMVAGSSMLPAMRSAGAGAYTIKVKAKGDGTFYSDGLQSIASASQTIVQLLTVSTGLTWTGNVAHWDTVANAVSYDVQFYKDGNTLNGEVNILAANAAIGVDFATAITGVGGGGGNYTYKVTAKGDGVLILDAVAQSAASNGNLVATPLPQVTNAVLSALGIAVWDNVANESNFEVKLYKDGTTLVATVAKAADTLTHNFLADMRSAGIGVYTVKVTAKGDGTNYSDGPQSLASTGQNITKLATVSAGLTWTGDVAHFTTVANAVSYDVQLYKDGNSLGTPVNVATASAAVGADFRGVITTNGGGTYTYKVTAIADVTTLFLDAAQSGSSNNKIKAIQLAQVTGATISPTGVISWDAVPNASSYEVEVFKEGSSQETTEMATGSSILPAMRLGGAGAYTIKVKAKGDGTFYSDGLQSIASASQIIVQLATVSAGLNWTGNIAHFTDVLSAVSYDVQLYKDGSSLGTSINVLAASVVTGVDFTSTIASGGYGTYTYKVTAKGDTNLILDAVQSVASINNIKEADLTAPTVGNSGIVTPSNATQNSIDLNWSAGNDNVTSAANLQYKVVKSTNNNIDTVLNVEANGTAVQDWSTNLTSKQATGLSASTTYYFNVIVKDEAGNKSVYTTATQASSAIPSTPINNLTAISGDGRVTLNFDAPTEATNVVVEQSIDGTNYTVVTTASAITATSTSSGVTGLNNGQEYDFRLLVTGGSRAGLSNVASAIPVATTPSAIAIDDLVAIPGDGEVTLKFSAPTGAASVIVQQSIDGLNYVMGTTSSAITVTSTSTKVTGLTNGTQYSFRIVVSGGMHAGTSNVVTATPVAATPQEPDDEPSNPSTSGGGTGSNNGDTNKVEDVIKEIVKIEVNGKTTNTNGINQEKIVKEVKETIKKSLDDIVVTNLETKLNSYEGAVNIKVSSILENIGKEIDSIINKNLGNASGAGKAKYEVKLSIIEEASKQKVFEKNDVTATEEGIEVQNLKDFTPYIVRFDIVVDGKVVGTRETKITTLDRTPPVVHDVEVKDGVLKVNATDNFKLNDKPYMLIVAE